MFFEQEFKRYQPLAYRWAAEILGEGALAEDVAQEALLIAYQSRRQLRQPAAFGGWLKRIVHSQCNRIRRQNRPGRVELAVEQLAAPQADPAQLSEGRAQVQRLRQAIKQLTPHQAAVVAMFYLEGYTLAEIGRQLKVGEGAVKKRLFDARQRLRRLLADEDPNDQ